jgi:hypothetical protein
MCTFVRETKTRPFDYEVNLGSDPASLVCYYWSQGIKIAIIHSEQLTKEQYEALLAAQKKATS